MHHKLYNNNNNNNNNEGDKKESGLLPVDNPHLKDRDKVEVAKYNNHLKGILSFCDSRGNSYGNCFLKMIPYCTSDEQLYLKGTHIYIYINKYIYV